MTNKLLNKLATDEVKRIIKEHILPLAERGILNLDIIPTSTGVAEEDKVRFSTICQTIFSDLEYDCNLNTEVPTLLNISWKRLSYVKDKDNLTNNISLVFNDISPSNAEWLTNPIRIANTDIYLSGYQIDSLHEHPYYILETSANLTPYLDNELIFNKYIPFHSDYLDNTKIYKYTPFGEQYPVLSAVEESQCIDYASALIVKYKSLILQLNEEYNKLTGQADIPEIKQQMMDILVSTVITVPQQYKNAQLKLNQDLITLYDIAEEETTQGFNVYFNADKIVSYVPTGYISDISIKYISGGDISSTVKITGVYFTNSINYNDKVQLNVFWYNNNYINPVIDHIEPVYNHYNYTLTSSLVDQWYDYYAKQYHDIAVNNISSYQPEAYNVFINTIIPNTIDLEDSYTYKYELKNSGYTHPKKFKDSNTYLDQNYKEQLIILQYLSESSGLNMEFNYNIPYITSFMYQRYKLNPETNSYYWIYPDPQNTKVHEIAYVAYTEQPVNIYETKKLSRHLNLQNIYYNKVGYYYPIPSSDRLVMEYTNIKEHEYYGHYNDWIWSHDIFYLTGGPGDWYRELGSLPDHVDYIAFEGKAVNTNDSYIYHLVNAWPPLPSSDNNDVFLEIKKKPV